jgi:hypothetical protein
MRDEENDRPAFGKRGETMNDGYEATPCARPFTAGMRILDRDVTTWNRARYEIRIYPAACDRVEVRVTRLDTEFTVPIYWTMRADDTQHAIADAVWDGIQQCEEQYEMEDERREEAEHDARSEKRTAGMDVDFDYSRFDCQR